MAGESKQLPENPSGLAATQAHGHDSAPELVEIAPRKALISVVVLFIVAVALAVAGILPRQSAKAALKGRTNALAPPTVIALRPKLGEPEEMFVLPGNVTAYTDAPIYARSSGYLAHWYFDIGARVKKGALLAVIDTPELDQQVAQAQADLSTAEAAANNARIQAERYSGLVRSDAVSQQDTDTFVNQAASTSAAVESAKANLQRLKQLQSFEKVYAPFDGVVTARNVDTGQLINAGAGSELFHMQTLNILRIYSNVPEIDSTAAKLGARYDVTFPEFPGRTFQGTLVRTAKAIDPVSRTLLVEVDVDNRSGELFPGSLAEVHFKTPVLRQTYIVPVSSLIFRREGLEVATLVDGNRAHLLHVTIGEDDGATAQIISGLAGSDKVIQDPPDSIIEGETVSPQSPEGTNTEGGQ